MKGKLELPNNSRQFNEDVLSPSDGEQEHSDYLAAVLPSFPVPGADEDVGNVLPEPGLLVHGLALRVVDDGEVDLLEDRGERSVCGGLMTGGSSVVSVTFIEPAPARDPGGLAHQGGVVLRHTDGDDVGLECHRLVKPEIM